MLDEPATHNSQPVTHNSQPATRNPQLATRNSQPATRNSQPITHNPALFFVHFFQIKRTVRQIGPLVNIVYPDIPDDAFLINKNERSFGNPIGT